MASSRTYHGRPVSVIFGLCSHTKATCGGTAGRRFPAPAESKACDPSDTFNLERIVVVMSTPACAKGVKTASGKKMLEKLDFMAIFIRWVGYVVAYVRLNVRFEIE